MQTNPAAEQNKNIKWSKSHGISPVGEEKVYGGKDLSQNKVVPYVLWQTQLKFCLDQKC